MSMLSLLMHSSTSAIQSVQLAQCAHYTDVAEEIICNVKHFSDYQYDILWVLLQEYLEDDDQVDLVTFTSRVWTNVKDIYKPSRRDEAAEADTHSDDHGDDQQAGDDHGDTGDKDDDNGDNGHDDHQHDHDGDHDPDHDHDRDDERDDEDYVSSLQALIMHLCSKAFIVYMYT